MTHLTSENVNEIFLKCLFDKGENHDKYTIGEGVKLKVGFHPGRLKENETKISEMLNELPSSFKKSGGGGWSFLNLVEDKNGKQWTDLHERADQLVALGTASGKMSYLMPRDMWRNLPGGMPYIVVND